MRGLILFGLLSVGAFAQAEENPQQEKRLEPQTPAQARQKKQTRFNLRFGAMFANQIQSGFQLNSRKAPILGVYIDTNNTLGMLNTETVPMFNISYQIKGNHLISFGAFSLKREATKVLEKEIELGDIVIPVGAEVYSFINTEYMKLKYNYIFFNHPKVKLTVGIGLHVSRIDMGLRSSGFLDADVGSKGTVPLPVFGGTMVYTLSNKLRFAVRLDEFYITYGNYQGTMTETNAVLEYQAFERIGFGFGMTRFMLDADMDSDEWYARLNNSYQGFSFYTAFKF